MPTSRPLPRSSRSRRTRSFPSDRNLRGNGRTGPPPAAGGIQGELHTDLAAMARVLRMLRQGAVRMVGEIGRQY